eukprot:CAMPEP_0178439866 /NCGR_PEP_ID=MMETSP0689_2-20121128/36418_1 /TAXON_ID=160604 /ORGANISM="Amphidinium massartii, Strain CS-259" /LENGTH=661 /DNA_ID=CAMNT_0020062491 /DNA_START=104 /DNA_END=2086 /DNA_ORIENTATION=+
MVHTSGTVLLCPQNLAVSGANQVLYNIAAGEFYRGNVVLVAPSHGPFAQKFQEIGVAVRIGKVEEILESVMDVRLAICNTIMTAHIVNMLQKKNVPCTWILHEWWTKEMIPKELAARNDKNLTVETVEQALASCSSTVCVCQKQLELYNPAHGKVIFVGTPSVDQECFEKITAQAQISKAVQPPVTTFLCMGIVCPRKNQAFTVKCFKAFAGDRQDVRLVIVGVRRIRDYEIKYVEEVEAAIAGDPRIELHDVTHEVDKFYAQADVVLLASLNEVTPMVLTEAFARGKPVMTTGIAGIPEMLTDGVEGYICPEEDTEESIAHWASRMGGLADDATLRESMGKAGFRRYEKQFRLDHMVNQYRELAIGIVRPIVLVDLDGTLVDWDAGFYKAWGDRPLVDRASYQIEKCVPPQFMQEAVQLFCSKGFFTNLPPMEGGIEALKEMAASGFEVFLCSSPLADSRYSAQEKWEWVREHLGDAWVNRLILTTDKTVVRGDILIDDKPVISGLQRPHWTQVLFDAPYNQDVDLGRRVRLHNWVEWKQSLYEALRVPLTEEDSSSSDEDPLKKPVCGITKAEVLALRDFSEELKGTSYTKDYQRWRKGGAKGARGDFWQAIVEMEKVSARQFLEGDDWSSVNMYRDDYRKWREGNRKALMDRRAGMLI